MTKRQKNWQGMNWIRPATRLAIYLRDGLACVYCGATIEDATRFELDHIKPHTKGGSNKPTNLVTSCSRCNASRGSRSVMEFAQAVSIYLDGDCTAEQIVQHVKNCRRRELPRDEARAILARRGTVKAALQCTA